MEHGSYKGLSLVIILASLIIFTSIIGILEFTPVIWWSTLFIVGSWCFSISACLSYMTSIGNTSQIGRVVFDITISVLSLIAFLFTNIFELV